MLLKDPYIYSKSINRCMRIINAKSREWLLCREERRKFDHRRIEGFKSTGDVFS